MWRHRWLSKDRSRSVPSRSNSTVSICCQSGVSALVPLMRVSYVQSRRGIGTAASAKLVAAKAVTGRLTRKIRDRNQPMAEIEDNVDRELFRNFEKLRQLRIEHRDLDEIISRLALDMHVDEIQMKRLKKRKLLLKDQIARVESLLIPDLNA